MRTLEERFWNKVDKTSGECWLWTGARGRGGYGHIGNGSRGTGYSYAHRISLEWKLGRKIGEGLVARHKCRNRNCVNPEHLEEGTHAENMEDMIRDGTSTRGTKCASSKLTEEQVLAIREDQRPQKEIAADYGIGFGTVSKIKLRTRWGWL